MYGRDELPQALVHHLDQPAHVAHVGGTMEQHLTCQWHVDGALELLVEVTAMPAGGVGWEAGGLREKAGGWVGGEEQ